MTITGLGILARNSSIVFLFSVLIFTGIVSRPKLNRFFRIYFSTAMKNLRRSLQKHNQPFRQVEKFAGLNLALVLITYGSPTETSLRRVLKQHLFSITCAHQVLNTFQTISFL